MLLLPHAAEPLLGAFSVAFTHATLQHVSPPPSISTYPTTAPRDPGTRCLNNSTVPGTPTATHHPIDDNFRCLIIGRRLSPTCLWSRRSPNPASQFGDCMA
jgi:hypothetical protein